MNRSQQYHHTLTSVVVSEPSSSWWLRSTSSSMETELRPGCFTCDMGMWVRSWISESKEGSGVSENISKHNRKYDVAVVLKSYGIPKISISLAYCNDWYWLYSGLRKFVTVTKQVFFTWTEIYYLARHLSCWVDVWKVQWLISENNNNLFSRIRLKLHFSANNKQFTLDQAKREDIILHLVLNVLSTHKSQCGSGQNRIIWSLIYEAKL